MTLHTPVVITDDVAVANVARQRRWPVVHRDGDALHLTGVQQTIPLPEPSMNIEAGSLSGPHVPGWKLVLDWLEKHLHRPMMVVEPNGWAQDLALWSASSRGWPVAAWVHGGPHVDCTAGAVALVSSSVGVLFLNDDVRSGFTSGWPSTVTDLSDAALIDVPRASAPTPSVRRNGMTRVLLVAYFAGANPAPSAQRVTSWFTMLEEVSGGDITVDLATATPWPGAPGRVHHVPDLGPATLAPGRGPIETWATAAFTHAADRAYAPTRYMGGYWHVALEDYFAARDDHYDVVIIAGDPFEYFGFAAWARDHWYARTVLDYGNSSALRRRRSLTGDAGAEAAYVERGWNMAADLVLVAEAESIDLIQPSGPDARSEVAPDPDTGNRGEAIQRLEHLIRTLESQP